MLHLFLARRRKLERSSCKQRVINVIVTSFTTGYGATVNFTRLFISSLSYFTQNSGKFITITVFPLHGELERHVERSAKYITQQLD